MWPFPPTSENDHHLRLSFSRTGRLMTGDSLAVPAKFPEEN
jgi:hypothetical protein